MRALERKLLRDARRLAGPAVALSAILACGVSAQVALRGAARSLERSRDDFYARTRFADVAVEVVRAPLSLAGDAAALPGVSEVTPRISAWALVEVPGFPDPVRLRAASLPEPGDAPLDAVVVREGTLPGSGEVLLGEAFARRHGLKPGAVVYVLLGGVRERLRVSGVGTAPDAVYVLAPALPFPDDARAGVMWLRREALAGPLQLEGAFTELLVRVGPGASVPALARALEGLLDRYGGAGALQRKEQPSHRFVEEELRQLAVQARFVPAVFLGVAAFLLRDVMARLLGTQRETVALLKALGYGRAALVRHYLALAGMLLLPGAVVGAASGVGLVRALLGLYAQYFRFDRLVPDVAASDVLASLGVAAGAGLLGAWASVRTATAIPPAEAMQPPVPPSYGHGLTRLPERVRGLSPGARMVWRTLLRRPGRTLLSVLGIALAGALLALSGIAWEGLNWVLERSFQDAAREDVSVTFADPLGRAALDELAGWPGVVRVEGERAVPVRLVGPGGRWDGSVTAREQGARLRRSLGRGGEELAPPAGDGLLLTDALARRLGLAAGGTAWVERRDGDRRAQAVRVSGLSTEVVGLAAQASPGTVRALFGGELYTGAYLRVEAGQEAAVLSRLARVPRVAGASLRRAGLSSFRRLMADSMDVTRAVLWLFASVLAAGVVYNDGRVALAEQARELATLRVLGFARAECARLFLGGLAVRVVASLAPGWALGWGFARLLMAQLSNSELFRLPLVTHPSTWVNGTGVVLLASAVTGAWLARAVWRLDLVAVLKARE